MSYPSHAATTDAFIALCVGALASTAALVGDGEEPAGVGWRNADGSRGTPGQCAFVPYVIVYPIGADGAESTIGAPYDDVLFEWQTTIVAASRRHGEIVFDLLAAGLVGATITVPDRDTSDHLRLTTSGGGVRREEVQQPPLWTATPRWGVTSVPA